MGRVWYLSHSNFVSSSVLPMQTSPVYSIRLVELPKRSHHGGSSFNIPHQPLEFLLYQRLLTAPFSNLYPSTAVMKFLRGETRPPSFAFGVLLLLIAFTARATAADACAASTWDGPILRRQATPTASSDDSISAPSSLGARSAFDNTISSIITFGDIEPGEINCRYADTTSGDVNYYTCTQLATRYGISIETFFVLNPALDLDCSNIQPNSDYCVSGCK